MAKIQVRRGLRADWIASSVILAAGEIGFAIDTGDIRVGDGVNTWTNLKEPAATALAAKASTVHTHAQSDITGLTTALSGKESTITAGTTSQYFRGDKTFQTLDKSAVGLGNVDNTSDATKNSATATLSNKTISGASNTLSNIPQSAVTNLSTDLSGKAPLASPTFTGTVSGITKSMVGLSNADNTSDANKPISTATQAALDAIPSGYAPPSGAWLQPSNLMNTTTGAPVAGTVYLSPFDVGPNSLQIQSIGTHVTTSQVGGTTTTTLGLYKDDGTGGAPLLTGPGLLVSGTITVTSLGRKTITTSLTLSPGRYWGAFLHTESAAPTTDAVFNVITNASPALWIPDSATIGSVGRALQIPSMTNLPTTTQTISTVTSGNVAPILALRAS